MLMPTGWGQDIPDETVQVAHAAFRKGNRYMQMRDLFGSMYEDEQFADLFAERGRPAERPWRLALVTVMQFAEGLSDRQAAEAVRDRISWKYALGLELTDMGFDYSVLSEFRTRLVEHQAEQRLFELLVDQLVAGKLLKARGRQRTDGTYVLAAVRALNRLELVGQTLHYALNTLADIAPDWVLEHVSADWFERYGKRFDDYRLPKGKAKRLALAETIGRDGVELFSQLRAAPAWGEWRPLPALQALRRIWMQQFYIEAERVYWREGKRQGPPSTLMISSPYDLDARYSTKRGLAWVGYKTHLTESCDSTHPHLITHVATTLAPVADIEVVEAIHADLAQKGLLPAEHVVDMGYVSLEVMVKSRDNYQVELVGEIRPDHHWQALAQEGFDLTQFTVDWSQQSVTCPAGQHSSFWNPARSASGRQTTQVGFAKTTCQACALRPKCTTNKTLGRTLSLPDTKDKHETLRAARAYQQTTEFKRRYTARAGIEGTLSQVVNPLAMRRSRYHGLPKTHLQAVLTATALNILRLVNWLLDKPLAQTRVSHFQALAPPT